MHRLAANILALLGLASMVASAGCGSPNLHPSFGQLYRDVNMAQLAAHPAHEPTVRGNEIQALIGRHDAALAGDAGGGGGGAMSGGSNKTAGVPPLH